MFDKFDKELLKTIDNHAYNRPDNIPDMIKRNDQADYRIYFRYMRLIYMLYRNNILGKDELTEAKQEFISDLSIYDVLYRAMIQSERKRRHMNEAIIACNKNKDNCPVCMGIYQAEITYIPDEKEADIEV